jgi:hypothetical protein
MLNSLQQKIPCLHNPTPMAHIQLTINLGILIRHPHARNKQAPLTTHQRAQKQATHLEKQSGIDEAVQSWFSATIAQADELAEKFGKKPRYFLDLFFHGGAHMIQKRKKVNPWNAFTSMKAKEVNSGKYFVILEIHLIYSLQMLLLALRVI